MGCTVVNNLCSKPKLSRLWREFISMSEKLEAGAAEALLNGLRGHDAAWIEEIRSMLPQKILGKYLGKITSKRWVKELFPAHLRFRLQKRFRFLSLDLKTGMAELSKSSSVSSAELADHGKFHLLNKLEEKRRHVLEEGYEFLNLMWPQAGLVVDACPQNAEENSWSFEILPREWSVSGLTGTSTDTGSYLISRPSAVPEHKVPDLLQRFIAAGRNLAEAENTIPVMKVASEVFENARGLPGFVQEMNRSYKEV